MLTCVTPVGWLQRMTQYKAKSEAQETVGDGVLQYPVLMAADILLYQASVVPVGDDQSQHLELTRDIAQRFNSLYGEAFVMPETRLPVVGAKIEVTKAPSTSNPRRFFMQQALGQQKPTEAFSDEEGSFAVWDLPAGLFDMKVTAPGYAPQELATANSDQSIIGIPIQPEHAGDVRLAARARQQQFGLLVLGAVCCLAAVVFAQWDAQQGIGRWFDNATYDPWLKTIYRCLGEEHIVPPPCSDWIALNPSMLVPLEEAQILFPGLMKGKGA